MRLTRLSSTLLWLTVLWILLWGTISVANVVTGIAVGVGVLILARQPARRRRTADSARIKPLATLRFAGYVLYKLVEANVILAWEIVTPRNRINTGVIAVPLRTESELAMLVVSSIITLTPGTITIDVKGSPPVLFVNVLHLHDLEAVRADLLDIEERSVRAFGSDNARAQLAARTAR
jgi:multicomponent Na+:H+ antiporter subunit E